MAKNTVLISATIQSSTVEHFKAGAKERGIPFSRHLDNVLTRFANQKLDNLDDILRSFGAYLMSDERRKNLEENVHPNILDQKLKVVSDEDLRFWSEKV